MEIYEDNPHKYVQELQNWFTAEEAEDGRAKQKNFDHHVTLTSDISPAIHLITH